MKNKATVGPVPRPQAGYFTAKRGPKNIPSDSVVKNRAVRFQEGRSRPAENQRHRDPAVIRRKTDLRDQRGRPGLRRVRGGQPIYRGHCGSRFVIAMTGRPAPSVRNALRQPPKYKRLPIAVATGSRISVYSEPTAHREDINITFIK